MDGLMVVSRGVGRVGEHEGEKDWGVLRFENRGNGRSVWELGCFMLGGSGESGLNSEF